MQIGSPEERKGNLLNPVHTMALPGPPGKVAGEVPKLSSVTTQIAKDFFAVVKKGNLTEIISFISNTIFFI